MYTTTLPLDDLYLLSPSMSQPLKTLATLWDWVEVANGQVKVETDLPRQGTSLLRVQW